MLALLSPVLLGLSGGAMDLFLYENHAKSLQRVADGAALAAVSEASLKGWSKATADAIVADFIDAHLQESGQATYTSTVGVDLDERTVMVTIDQDNHEYFVLGYFKHSPQIRVSATAQASGSTKVCVIGLDETLKAAVSLNSNAVLTAADCAVYSNSRSPVGLQSKSNSVLTAVLSCSAGGYEGSPRNFRGAVLTDCPAMILW
jgi:hypothetical protein